MNLFLWMLVQWTSTMCPFHISKKYFWWQVHFKADPGPGPRLRYFRLRADVYAPPPPPWKFWIHPWNPSNIVLETDCLQYTIDVSMGNRKSPSNAWPQSSVLTSQVTDSDSRRLESHFWLTWLDSSMLPKWLDLTRVCYLNDLTWLEYVT